MIDSIIYSPWFDPFGSELAELGVMAMKEFKTYSSIRAVSIIRTGALGGGIFR